MQVISWAAEYGDYTALILNGGMLLLALPLHGVFCKYLWDQQPQPLTLLIALGPLAVLSLLLAQTDAIRYLAGSGIVMAAMQYFSMKHNRRAGMKVI